MMKGSLFVRRTLLLLCSICVACVGCASNVNHRLGGTRGGGTLVITFTEATKNVSVTVDGELVCDDAHTERVTVSAVPPGRRQVVVSGGGDDRDPLQHAQDVQIEANRTTTVTVAAPARSTSAVVMSALALLLLLPIIWLPYM